MRLARVLGFVGRFLIWTGSIILAFVVYQLWGTNIAEARAQNDLEAEFEALIEDPSATTTIPDEPDEPAPTTTTAPPPPPDDGEAAARLVIPRIGVDKIVVEGVGRRDLQKAPGHYPDTPMPGQPGNAAIAGHRTTYGAPFHRIDELEVGDEILVTTLQGSFTYIVSGQQIVSPRDVEVVANTEDDRLTLTSCHPKFSARQRIVVTALLQDEPAPAPPPTTVVDGDGDGDGDENGDGDEPPAPEDDPTVDDGVLGAPGIESLDGDDAREATPAVVWGAVALGVWLFFFWLSRRWRRWPAYLLGAPVFAVALFVFFEAFALLLPANF